MLVNKMDIIKILLR